jgi:hypothetical protein
MNATVSNLVAKSRHPLPDISIINRKKRYGVKKLIFVGKVFPHHRGESVDNRNEPPSKIIESYVVERCHQCEKVINVDSDPAMFI